MAVVADVVSGVGALLVFLGIVGVLEVNDVWWMVGLVLLLVGTLVHLVTVLRRPRQEP